MAPKWYKFGEKNLQKGDHIEKNYDGRLDGDYGHLMMSDSKLLFVKEEGVLRKKYTVTLNLPYEKIEEIKPVGKYNLRITEKSGNKQYFVILDGLSASIVDKSVHELMTQH